MDRELDDMITTRTGRRGGGFRRGAGGAQRRRAGGFGGGYMHDDRTSEDYEEVDNRPSGGAFRRNRSTVRRSNPYTRPAASSGSVDGHWEHDKFEEEVDEEELEDFNQSNQGNRRAPRGLETGTKLQIDNLAYSVLADDLQDLFEEFGDLKRATVHFDKSGRSLGKATVVFARRVDAIAAMKQYNNVALDEQPMKITLVSNSALANDRLGGGGGGGGAGGFRKVVREAITISVGEPRTRRFAQGGAGGIRRVGGIRPVRTLSIRESSSRRGGARGGRGGRGGRGSGRHVTYV